MSLYDFFAESSLVDYKITDAGLLAFTLQLVALAVVDRFALALAELPQHVEVNAVIAELLFHRRISSLPESVSCASL